MTSARGGLCCGTSLVHSCRNHRKRNVALSSNHFSLPLRLAAPDSFSLPEQRVVKAFLSDFAGSAYFDRISYGPSLFPCASPDRKPNRWVFPLASRFFSPRSWWDVSLAEWESSGSHGLTLRRKPRWCQRFRMLFGPLHARLPNHARGRSHA
jgi:hypothetical protein